MYVSSIFPRYFSSYKAINALFYVIIFYNYQANNLLITAYLH